MSAAKEKQARERMQAFLKKVLRQRKFLVETGRSKKNAMQCLHLIDRIEKFLDFYPNIRPAALQKYMRRHEVDILFLIPKKQNETNSQLQELSELLSLEL